MIGFCLIFHYQPLEISWISSRPPQTKDHLLPGNIYLIYFYCPSWAEKIQNIYPPWKKNISPGPWKSNQLEDDVFFPFSGKRPILLGDLLSEPSIPMWWWALNGWNHQIMIAFSGLVVGHWSQGTRFDFLPFNDDSNIFLHVFFWRFDSLWRCF